MRPIPIPASPEETVDQAASATRAAWMNGVSRQCVELLLPLIGATDLDDWPGGIRQQFQAATPMVEGLLRDLKQTEGLDGRLNAEILEDADCVGAWYGEKLLAILFPTADVLNKVESLCKGKPLSLLINTQWRGGQVVSDFGIGGQRQRKEEFVSSFEMTYCLRQYRLQGSDVRLLRCYPRDWQVHLVSQNGSDELLSVEKDQPSYKRLEEILKERGTDDDNGPQGLFDRIRKEFEFNVDSLKPPQ